MRLAILASHPIQYQVPLFRELARRHDITVYFAHRSSAKDQSTAGFGVGFEWDIDLLSDYEYGFLDNVSPKPGLEHFSGCDTPSITAKLRDGCYTALLVMGWHLKCFVQGIWGAKRLGLPVMVRGDSQLETPRGMAKRVAKRLLYPPALRCFDAALYVGERSRRYWEYYRYPPSRLFFSPHCVDNNWFSRRATREAGRMLRARCGIEPDANVVLFAGKLVPFKRPLDVIAAVSSLAPRFPDLTVVIAGDGEVACAISAAASKSGVRAVQLGFCNQTEMPAAYAAANVLALPSDGRETWGLVANEALACGLPIIVSDACGCAPDLVADGTTGRVFPMGSVTALAERIATVLVAPPAGETIARKVDDYSVPKAAEGIDAAFDMVSTRWEGRP